MLGGVRNYKTLGDRFDCIKQNFKEPERNEVDKKLHFTGFFIGIKTDRRIKIKIIGVNCVIRPT